MHSARKIKTNVVFSQYPGTARREYKNFCDDRKQDMHQQIVCARKTHELCTQSQYKRRVKD